MLLHGESVHSVSLTYFLFLKFQLVCLVCCVLYVVFILVPLFCFVCCFFFVLLLFACLFLVFVRFVVEGSLEFVLVMVTFSFLLFPFSVFLCS